MCPPHNNLTGWSVQSYSENQNLSERNHLLMIGWMEGKD